MEARRGIRFDEEQIAEHDKERGTRQKIEEAKTPYNYEYDEPQEDEDEPANQMDMDRLNKQLEDQRKKQEFEAKRKAHYNEFQMVQRMRHQGRLDDED